MLLSGFSTSKAGSSSLSSYLGAFLTSQSTTTESSVQQIVPVGGTIANLNVKIGTNAGSSNSWTFTVRKNGVSTGVTCSVSGSSATTCASATTVAFVAGDLISLQATPSGGPNDWGSIRWGVTLAS